MRFRLCIDEMSDSIYTYVFIEFSCLACNVVYFFFEFMFLFECDIYIYIYTIHELKSCIFNLYVLFSKRANDGCCMKKSQHQKHYYGECIKSKYVTFCVVCALYSAIKADKSFNFFFTSLLLLKKNMLFGKLSYLYKMCVSVYNVKCKYLEKVTFLL